MMKSISYQDNLIKSPTDPEESAGYLNAALEGGDIEVFLLVLKKYSKSTRLAKQTYKSRTSLNKTLSDKVNPHLKIRMRSFLP